MNEQINERVSVVSVYDRFKGTVLPVKIRWQGREFVITKFGYYHKRKEGRVILHTFSVSTDTMFFKLTCNSETLHWTLEEVSDGFAS